MKSVIYLAGLIDINAPESLLWRERVIVQLNDIFEVRSPLRGKGNLAENTRDGGLTCTCASNKAILLRDRNDVRESNIILANLETFGSTRSLIGTIAELAWSWDQKLPIIAIAKKENKIMWNHPFINEFIAHYEETENGAVKFIRRYYGENSS